MCIRGPAPLWENPSYQSPPTRLAPPSPSAASLLPELQPSTNLVPASLLWPPSACTRLQGPCWKMFPKPEEHVIGRLHAPRGCWQFPPLRQGGCGKESGEKDVCGAPALQGACRLPQDGCTSNGTWGRSSLHMGMGCPCSLPGTTCHRMEWKMVQDDSPTLACGRRPRSWGLQGEEWPEQEKGCFLP